MENKRGISGIVLTLIMILLVIALIAIVWVVVKGMVEESTSSSESCFNIYEKVSLNEQYTCWNTSENYMQFSINVADIDLDSVVVTISGEGTTKAFTITNTNSTITGLDSYPSDGTGDDDLRLPNKNEGRTYVYIGGEFTSTPDSLEISPVVNDNQCGVADSVNEIGSC